MDTPLVKKLPVLDWSRFPRADLLAEHTSCLDLTLQNAITEGWAVDDLHRAQTSTLHALRKELSARVASSAEGP
jgi:hypothetical protein